MRVLITGAAGGIGRLIRSRLRRDGRELRLFDIATVAPAEDGEPVELLTGSVTDPSAVRAACDGVDAIIHLGGLSREAPWADTLDVNVNGTQVLLEAAREAGVRRVILASSNHAVGYHPVTDNVAADLAPQPDTYYGVSKAAIEALGALYAHRFGMDVICVRIGMCFPKPMGVRGLALWLSPDDCGRLLEACLSAPSPGYRLVWGVSRNTRGYVSLAEAEALGYKSQDDSEVFAAEILASDTAAHPENEVIGGGFTITPLGEANPL
ncbi:NAD-dependent epimerase/dehydratase family protein [Fodinicola acaciae]|uniref:NAD-dependent epimerase/dehydratase family protein n=1 Tax=Fodinicola acaciae TaxID=2681555 RepID=UPI001C9E1D66|nr:NAD(P)-dependent oxidoreductase [Fodinicola acaciae]